MMLKKFRVSLFDRLDWDWKEFEIVAEDSETVLSYIDERFNPQFRRTPYSMAEEDSLDIRLIADVELPIVTELK